MTNTTCASLLGELQDIWNKVGELDDEKDRMLFDIDQECLAVYLRKVDEAKRNKAELEKAIASFKAEITFISSSMRDQEIHCEADFEGSLKEELKILSSQVENMRNKKMQRKTLFVEILGRLQKISEQIGRSIEDDISNIVARETDMSLEKLEELRTQLVDFQNEKINRQKLVSNHMEALNSLCLVLGINFKDTTCEIHSSFDGSEENRDVSKFTIEKLDVKIKSLQQLKIQRMQKLEDLSIALLELWNLLDTPMDEQQKCLNVTSAIAATEPEITEPNILSIDSIKHIEEEVSRLHQLKSSKIKELILKRKSELFEICKGTHMVTQALTGAEFQVEAIESGTKDSDYILDQIELQISTIKEQAFTRKEILEKVDKWLAACEEECWLEEYNRDDNRYNAGRGTHLALKRAEKARVLVNKIPGIVEALISKTTAWEKVKGVEFSYDGVPLIFMLEQYITLRQEKDLERQRQRDRRKLQGQLITEQETFYGARVSPSKTVKKAPRVSEVFNNRKLSVGGAMLQNLKPEKATQHTPSIKKIQNNTLRNHPSVGSRVQFSGKNIASQLSKKHPSLSSKARVTNSPQVRKPLSPIPLSFSSKVNIANFLDDQRDNPKRTSETTPSGCKTPPPPSAAMVSVFTGNEENRMPRTIPIPIPVPTTPAMWVPMLMTNTPATPSVYLGERRTLETRLEQVEYSFEESRADFIYHKNQLR